MEIMPAYWNIIILLNCFRKEEEERERRGKGERRWLWEKEVMRQDSKTIFASLSSSRILIFRLSKPRSLSSSSPA
jgi:hypothetical protein